jgi:hypothetical protein
MATSESASISQPADSGKQIIYGPPPGQIDYSIWASLVAALFRETALTRAGATWRALLLLAFLGGLVALLITEIV